MYDESGEGHYGDRPIWLKDIHLLAGRFQESDWAGFLADAARSRTKTICLDALRATQTMFGTSISPKVLAALEPRQREPSARLLNGSVLAVRWREFWALPDWRTRLDLVRGEAFPPASYILQKYGFRSRALLPWLYLRRLVGGVGQLLQRRAKHANWRR